MTKLHFKHAATIVPSLESLSGICCFCTLYHENYIANAVKNLINDNGADLYPKTYSTESYGQSAGHCFGIVCMLCVLCEYDLIEEIQFT